jgi:sugar O-acyltransferase (sialic acid O-acetyltransferase NeuD family)
MPTDRRDDAGFVLFGVGSPVLVDVVESCRRAGRIIAAGIANRAGPQFLPDGMTPTSVGDISPDMKAFDCLCPMFKPANRFVAVSEAQSLGFRFGRYLVDPTAIIASDFRSGAGSYVNAGVTIGAATRLGDHVFINRAATIGHHNEIGSFVSIAPGAVLTGQITVARGATIGAGAIICPGVRIGSHAVVGAGAVVLGDVPACRQVIGAPARVVKEPLAGFGNASSD